MLIAVLADTHDNMPVIDQAVQLLSERGAVQIVHAGDFIAPFALKALLRPGIPLVGVFGNNDGEKAGLRKLCASIYEPPHKFELEDRTIVLTHDPEGLSEEITKGADMIVWGHTHKLVNEKGPPLKLNPGEVGRWLYGVSTMALVDLEDLSVEIVELDA